MMLSELIKRLEAEPRKDKVLALGFHNPHSYRGYYEDLAFEPAKNVTVAAMLKDARSALGTTYHGWKSGEYTMTEWTDVWMALQGCCGETIGHHFLELMLANVAD